MPPLGPRMRQAIKAFLESDHLGMNVHAKFARATFQSTSVQQGRGLLGLPNHHVNYGSGLSDEEIARFSVAPDDYLEVWMLQAQLKGGGSDANVSVEVYDLSAGASLATVTAGNRVAGGDTPLGSPAPAPPSS